MAGQPFGNFHRHPGRGRGFEQLCCDFALVSDLHDMEATEGCEAKFSSGSDLRRNSTEIFARDYGMSCAAAHAGGKGVVQRSAQPDLSLRVAGVSDAQSRQRWEYQYSI